jgi:predicted glycosyl hydrolase (DUF1957 family)
MRHGLWRFEESFQAILDHTWIPLIHTMESLANERITFLFSTPGDDRKVLLNDTRQR